MGRPRALEDVGRGQGAGGDLNREAAVGNTDFVYEGDVAGHVPKGGCRFDGMRGVVKVDRNIEMTHKM